VALSSPERTELRERVAATLAEVIWPDVELLLDHFGFVVDDESGAEDEEYILNLLEGHDDDTGLVELDRELHPGTVGSGGGESDDSEDGLAVGDDGQSIFAGTHGRLRALRRFLSLIEAVVDDQAMDQPESPYEKLRRERHPHLSRPPIDPAAVELRYEAAREFPLIAWAPSLMYSFSVLERFLGDITGLSASLYGRPIPDRVGNPKIEGWLKELASLGVNVRIAPETMLELQSLRVVRNALAHRLTLAPLELPDSLRRDLNMLDPDRILPTASLVRRALRAVDDTVHATETGFRVWFSERHASRDDLRRRPGEVWSLGEIT
jgi:hypothetical protein